jgi:hypothetical protein
MTNLSDIIERLEKAEAGSRELDALIWCHFAAVKYQSCNEPYGGGPLTQVVFTIPPKRARMVTGKGHGSNPMYQHAEPVTTSVDAAISLAEKVLPGWAWKLGTCCVSDDAWVTPDFNSPVHGERLKREFPNLVAGSVFDTGVDIDLRPSGRPAIALCIAILTALKAKAQQQEGGE